MCLWLGWGLPEALVPFSRDQGGSVDTPVSCLRVSCCPHAPSSLLCSLGHQQDTGPRAAPSRRPQNPHSIACPSTGGTTRITLPYSQTLSPCHHRARLWDLSPSALVTPCTAAGLLRIHPKTQLLAVGDRAGGSAPCCSSALRCQDWDHPNFGPRDSNEACPSPPGRGCRWQGRTNLGTGHEWGWWLRICPVPVQLGTTKTGTLVLP